jgi:hypothetical protein
MQILGVEASLLLIRNPECVALATPVALGFGIRILLLIRNPECVALATPVALGFGIRS